MAGFFVVGGAGAEVGADAVVETGADSDADSADSMVGFADPVHPASASRINVPTNSEAKGPKGAAAFIIFLRFN